RHVGRSIAHNTAPVHTAHRRAACLPGARVYCDTGAVAVVSAHGLPGVGHTAATAARAPSTRHPRPCNITTVQICGCARVHTGGSRTGYEITIGGSRHERAERSG